MSKNHTRRTVIVGLGVVPVAAVTASSPAMADVPKPDRLEKLIKRYDAETDNFNAVALDLTDDEANALAEGTYNKTMREMTGVPATTAAGALAALAFIEREKLNENFPCLFNDAVGSLVQAVRGYLEQGGQS